MDKVVFRTRADAEQEVETMRWYLASGECPEEHKAHIRSAIGKIMDALAKTE